MSLFFNKSFAKEPLEVRQKLRIIFTTPETTSLAIAAGKNVSKDLKKRVTKELISYSLTEEGAKVLAQVGLSKPVTTNYEKDYKIIEKLNLEEFLKP